MIRTIVAVTVTGTVVACAAALAALSAATYAARVIDDDDFDLWEDEA